MPSYLLPHTQIVKKRKEICLYKKLLFQLFNPHPHSHLEGTLINLYMNEKRKILWLRKGGSPLKDRRNQQNKSVGI